MKLLIHYMLMLIGAAFLMAVIIVPIFIVATHYDEIETKESEE